MDLSTRSDEELLSGIASLCAAQRELTAKLVAYLSEIEERRLHLKAGFSSLFEFCDKQLRLSEGEAFRRIVAARLGRRFPIIHRLIASGAVHLSALELLRDRLTEENHGELLEAASGKSKREVEALIAVRFPKPDVPTRIRKLPVPRREAQPQAELTLAPEATPRPPAKPARILPLSEARFKVEFTARAALRDKLERARDLLSHANPSRALDVVVERAVDLLLAELERNKLAKLKRTRRKQRPTSTKPARVSRAVRREVFERDGLRCTYVSPDGHRCEARAFLELDHIEPKRLGGADEATNLRVRCRTHNQLWAEQAYGREHVERLRHLRQQRCGAKPAGSTHEECANTPMPAEKVCLALIGMGFREAQARDALASVSADEGTRAATGVEQLLRKALLVIRETTPSRLVWFGAR